jgi:hypothetical protein
MSGEFPVDERRGDIFFRPARSEKPGEVESVGAFVARFA